MSRSKPARPLYLDGEEGGTFALFFDALDRRRETAVLLCPPFGWYSLCPYCVRRDWVEHLAAGGYPTLQIDLPGSGNSAGNPDDPARLQMWTQAVSAAARWLQARSGAPRIVAIGIELGGLIAHRAVSEQAPIDDLVLWAVPARGRALVRELRVYSRLPASSVSAPGEGGAPLLPEGALLAAGYLLSAETVATLDALDLTELPLPNGKHRRALLLGRGGPTVDELLRGCLEQEGVEVSVASARGLGGIVKVFERVDSWLADGEAKRDRLSVRVGPQRRGRVSAEAEEPSSREHLSLSCAGVELRETPVWVDRPRARLFGLLTESPQRQAQLCAVLLAGHHRHTGPNRMWVEIARRWAARGVPTLRIDLSGVGDSWIADFDGDASRDVGAFFAPEYVDETCAVLDMLRARGLPTRYVLLGLAAGAYWSMQAALRDEQVAAIIMLNPRALIWSAQVVPTRRMRSLRRRLSDSSTLRKVARGEIALGRFVEVSRSLSAESLRTSLDRSRRIARSLGGNEIRRDPLECLLDTLRDRGQQGLLVFTGSEPLHEELAAMGLFDRLDRWPNLELLTIETPVETHLLTPLWVQRQVHQVVDGFLDRELEQVPERAISSSG